MSSLDLWTVLTLSSRWLRIFYSTLQDNLSSIDILSACNLVNYFGKMDLGGSGVGQIMLYPILIRKVDYSAKNLHHHHHYKRVFPSYGVTVFRNKYRDRSTEDLTEFYSWLFTCCSKFLAKEILDRIALALNSLLAVNLILIFKIFFLEFHCCIIFQGTTTVALYGLGNIRDERLNRMFQVHVWHISFHLLMFPSLFAVLHHLFS